MDTRFQGGPFRSSLPLIFQLVTSCVMDTNSKPSRLSGAEARKDRALPTIDLCQQRATAPLVVCLPPPSSRRVSFPPAPKYVSRNRRRCCPKEDKSPSERRCE